MDLLTVGPSNLIRHEDIEAIIASEPEILDLVGQRLQLVADRDLKTRSIRPGRHIRDLVQMAKGKRLVILDTVNRAVTPAGINEADNSEMGPVVAVLEIVCRLTGAALLVVHHASKDAALNSRDDVGAVRGASALTDNARWVALMRAMSVEEAGKLGLNDPGARQGFIRLGVPKCNLARLWHRWLVRGEGGLLRGDHDWHQRLKEMEGEQPVSARDDKRPTDAIGLAAALGRPGATIGRRL